MKPLRLIGLLIAAGLAAGSGALAAPAPQVAITSLRELPSPLPLPYDPQADAERQVARAKAKALADGKLLLVDLGGNWCPDCRLLAGVMRLPEVSAFLAAHYEVVSIDVGRMDRNLQIPARYGVGALEGVPSILIIDRRGRLVDRGHVAALADARSMQPQALADWLAQWTN